MLVPEGVHTSWMLPLSELVAVTVVVAVTLVPVVALLVDRLVLTVDTEARTDDENNNIPTIETAIIKFLFILHLWPEHISYINKFLTGAFCNCSFDEYRWLASGCRRP